MCNYTEFWNDLRNLSQKDIVKELVELFQKFGLLDEGGKPKERAHFELKRWKNDYMHDQGRKELTKHIVAMANTIIKNPAETAILAIGIAEDKPLNELPYEQDCGLDGLRINVDSFLDGLTTYIRNNTVPEFPVEKIEQCKIIINRRNKNYPIIFLKIPVEISHFYGIKSGDEEIFCLKFVRREIRDSEPESRTRSLLHLIKDIHKSVVFEVFSGYGYPREFFIEVDQNSREILDKGIPLDIVEFENLIGRETLRRQISYWDYLIEKKLIQKFLNDKWVLSYTALLLFGSRNVQLKSLSIPEIEIFVDISSYTNTEGISPRLITLIPLRKAFEEVFNTLEDIISELSLPYYDWDELKPAFYEILLNSVLHNNYYSYNPKIKIELRESSIYVENKCLWDVSGLPIEKLASPAFPKPNPEFYIYLKELKFLKDEFPDFLDNRSVLHGLMKLLKYLIHKGFPIPSFNLSNGIFGVELPINKKFTEEIERIENILSSKEFYLRDKLVRGIKDLEISGLLALYLQVIQHIDNPEQKFNEFFEGTLKIYKDFIEKVQEELNQSGGE